MSNSVTNKAIVLVKYPIWFGADRDKLWGRMGISIRILTQKKSDESNPDKVSSSY